ncbi:hypothetical protein BDK51DRAFT_49103 [Blyttiomyces helicus]|uniref:Uncharacterized protein n=1 Tax=Blyttiomyces helicus TaxID=388810 RepID=A0A4P9W131_9FUNG|nr:hypothetical protein BDK51DRAFT_49103 [Blyttiomyces helicus]|eukprot:RKO84398.1 hypothetical protein BDK51DRAFT_49103 [Blyttiomyces helicus]
MSLTPAQLGKPACQCPWKERTCGSASSSLQRRPVSRDRCPSSRSGPFPTTSLRIPVPLLPSSPPEWSSDCRIVAKAKRLIMELLTPSPARFGQTRGMRSCPKSETMNESQDGGYIVDPVLLRGAWQATDSPKQRNPDLDLPFLAYLFSPTLDVACSGCDPFCRTRDGSQASVQIVLLCQRTESPPASASVPVDSGSFNFVFVSLKSVRDLEPCADGAPDCSHLIGKKIADQDPLLLPLPPVHGSGIPGSFFLAAQPSPRLPRSLSAAPRRLPPPRSQATYPPTLTIAPALPFHNHPRHSPDPTSLGPVHISSPFGNPPARSHLSNTHVPRCHRKGRKALRLQTRVRRKTRPARRFHRPQTRVRRETSLAPPRPLPAPTCLRRISILPSARFPRRSRYPQPRL